MSYEANYVASKNPRARVNMILNADVGINTQDAIAMITDSMKPKTCKNTDIKSLVLNKRYNDDDLILHMSVPDISLDMTDSESEEGIIKYRRIRFSAGQLFPEKMMEGTYNEIENYRDRINDLGNTYAIELNDGDGTMYLFDCNTLKEVIRMVMGSMPCISLNDGRCMVNLNVRKDRSRDDHKVNMVTFLGGSFSKIPFDEHITTLRRVNFYFGHEENMYGFMPFDEPLSRLPDEFEEFNKIALSLSSIISNKNLRAMISKLPLLNFDKLTERAQVQRAYSWLAIVSASYIWCEGLNKGLNVLPRQLAVPLHTMASRLGIKPCLTHAAVDLWNWYTIDKSKGITMDNLHLHCSMTGTTTEDAFFLSMTEIEGIGGEMMDDLLNIQPLVMKGEKDKVKTILMDFMLTMNRINEVMRQMSRICDPGTFFNVLRPFLHGSGTEYMPDGLLFEGVDDERMKLTGGSAAQSSLIALIDAIFGIVHKGENSAGYLKKIRDYMPFSHAMLVEHVENLSLNHQLRQFCIDNSMEDIYDECVTKIAAFRTIHKGIVHKFIVKMIPVPEGAAKGTGGTTLNVFLDEIRKDGTDVLIKKE